MLCGRESVFVEIVQETLEFVVARRQAKAYRTQTVARLSISGIRLMALRAGAMHTVALMSHLPLKA
jgi:hypothetical protein